AALDDVWNPEEDDALVCLDVQQETHYVKTFTFASREGKRFAFKAWQYFLFDLEHNGDAENRCYSISSSPHRTNAFSVT
ncbi:hybrid-cluster NAD(P)-dependent oxidoreductase, partial [Rhizobium ruizarguesonis]